MCAAGRRWIWRAWNGRRVLQPAGGGAEVDRRRWTSIRCWHGREQLVTSDARVVLHDPDTKESDLPRPAIQRYPVEYAGEFTTHAAATVGDPPDPAQRSRPMMVKFHETLSERTVYQRYLRLLNVDRAHGARAADAVCLDRLCRADGAGGGADETQQRASAGSGRGPLQGSRGGGRVRSW